MFSFCTGFANEVKWSKRCWTPVRKHFFEPAAAGALNSHLSHFVMYVIDVQVSVCTEKYIVSSCEGRTTALIIRNISRNKGTDPSELSYQLPAKSKDPAK